MSGLEILHAIQSVHSPFLDSFFGFMTNLHHADFYLLFFPPLYWLYDKRFTRYLLSVFLLGTWSNAVLKGVFHTARPPADAVRKLYEASAGGPAFPSGHAQNPLMFWGAIALQVRWRWLTVLLGTLVFLIGYSRLYGGVHWPLDVLGGWLIGALMLAGFEATRPFWTGENQRLSTQLIIAVCLPLLTLALSLAGAGFSAEADLGEVWKLVGAWIGFWVGACLEEEFVGFDPRAGRIPAHVLKLVFGLAVAFGVRTVLKEIFPATGPWDLIRYLIITFVGAYVLPWIFRRYIGSSPTLGPSARREHTL